MTAVTWAAAALMASTAGAASAQGFRGAEIDLSSTAYTEDTEVGQTTLQGSVEFGFNANSTREPGVPENFKLNGSLCSVA